MSSKNIVPNGPVIAGSAVYTDIVIGNNCTDATVLKVYGVISSCSGIISKSFTTNPGGATLKETTLSGLSAPINPKDATNKEYVDMLSLGLEIKTPVDVATIGNISLTGLQLIDGYSLQLNDRILVKDQINGIENGIYIVSSGSWIRSSDLPNGSNASRTAVNVLNGIQNGGSIFVCTNTFPNDITGSDPLTFDLFISGLIPGIGLSKNGNILNVNLDNIGLEVNGSNIIRIKNGGITNNNLQNDYININTISGIIGGGNVQLGSTINLTLDNTVVRTTGIQTISGPKTFSDSVILGSGSYGITLQAPVLSNSYFLTFPVNQGLPDQFLKTNGLGTLTWAYNTSGDVYGPNSSTDNAVARFDGTTGKIIQNSNVIISDSGNVNAASYTDGIATLSGGTLTGLNPPILNSDAVNKKYVDDAINGLKWKQPARVATTTNITLTGLIIIDGINLNNGDRVLVKNQINPIQNGLYNASSSYWSRTSDMSIGSSASSSVVWIEEGLTQAETGFICTNDIGSDIVGINPLSWLQFTGSGSTIIAGAGLTKIVNTLSVNVDNSTIEIVSNNLQVKALGIKNAQIANSTISNIKLVNSYIGINTINGITGGSTVSLGGSINLQVDSTVVRTFGNQNITGLKTFSNINVLGITNTSELNIDSESISGQRLYYGYDSSGLLTATSTYQTIVFTSIIIDPGYINNYGEITIYSSGTYEIQYHSQFETIDMSKGQIATINTIVELNSGFGFNIIPGSGSSCFFTEQNGNLASFGSGKSVIYNINPNSIIRIRFSRVIGTSTCRSKPNESSLIIKRLRPL
jgi:hypothetical protein